MALEREEELILEIKVTFNQRDSAILYPLQKLVENLLKNKQGKVRESWEEKVDVGRKSITKERFDFIESKLRN